MANEGCENSLTNEEAIVRNKICNLIDDGDGEKANALLKSFHCHEDTALNFLLCATRSSDGSEMIELVTSICERFPSVVCRETLFGSFPLLNCRSRAIAGILLRHGADVNQVSSKKYTAKMPVTPLMASVGGNDDLTIFLLDHGANIKYVDCDGFNVLFALLASSNVTQNSFRLLVEKGADPLHTTPDGQTLLMTACECIIGDPDHHQDGIRMEIIKYLVEELHVPVDAESFGGNTALKLSHPHKELVKYLIFVGKASIDLQTETCRQTPLMHAANFGNFTNVKTLVELGAKVNLVDEDGMTVLDQALDNPALNNAGMIIPTLVNAGALCRPRDTYRVSPTAFAYMHQYPEHFLRGVAAFLAQDVVSFVNHEESERMILKTDLEWGSDIPVLHFHELPYHRILDGLTVFRQTYQRNRLFMPEWPFALQFQIEKSIKAIAQLAHNNEHVNKRVWLQAQEAETRLASSKKQKKRDRE